MMSGSSALSSLMIWSLSASLRFLSRWICSWSRVAASESRAITSSRSRCSDLSSSSLRRRVEALRSEHRDLDDVIARLSEAATVDQLQIQRLKKRKLALKDQIAKLESALLPDIIA